MPTRVNIDRLLLILGCVVVLLVAVLAYRVFGIVMCVHPRPSTPPVTVPPIVYRESETIQIIRFESDGSTQTDESPAGNDMFQTNMNRRAVHTNYNSGDIVCMWFDGIDDFFEGYAPIITNYPFTVQAWVRGDGDLNDTKGDNIWAQSDASDFRNYGRLAADEGAARAMAEERDSGAQEAANSPGDRLFGSNWYHVVAVFNSASNRQVYIDGTDGDTNTTTKTINWSVVDNVCIGNKYRNGAIGKTWEGPIDFVVVWTAALSDVEIDTNLFDAQKTPYGK